MLHREAEDATRAVVGGMSSMNLDGCLNDRIMPEFAMEQKHPGLD